MNIVEVPQSGHAPDGSITSKQVAEVTLPAEELERLWTPDNLERLARTYWRFLSRISLGLLRVLYTEDTREIVVPDAALRAAALPGSGVRLRGGRRDGHLAYREGAARGPGRGAGKGFLRLSVRRIDREPDAGHGTVWVSSEVANFYPTIARWGWSEKMGRAVYRATQLRIHIIVTHAFLRSLARLDLAESRVGALLPPSPAAPPRSPAASGDRGER